MLHFTFGAPASFHLTLGELATLPAPVYLFVFTRVVRGQVKALVLSPEESTDRSDRFALDIDAQFAGMATGQYVYEVYEQTDITNTDPAAAGARLEVGVMHLHPQVPFAFTMRTPTTEFIQPLR